MRSTQADPNDLDSLHPRPRQNSEARGGGFVRAPLQRSGYLALQKRGYSGLKMWSEESAAEDSNASGAEHLLPRVLATPGLLRACTAYQDGVEFCRYVDGDVAAAQGHLSLLRLRRSLCEKNVAKGDNGDESISSRDGGSGSGVGGGGGGGCYSSYRSIASEVEGEEKGENREHQEAKPLPRIGNEAEEKGDEEHRAGAPLLEDLNFSHRAADWAAAQGHLEVVRSVIIRSVKAVLLRLVFCYNVPSDESFRGTTWRCYAKVRVYECVLLVFLVPLVRGPSTAQSTHHRQERMLRMFTWQAKISTHFNVAGVSGRDLLGTTF